MSLAKVKTGSPGMAVPFSPSDDPNALAGGDPNASAIVAEASGVSCSLVESTIAGLIESRPASCSWATRFTAPAYPARRTGCAAWRRATISSIGSVAGAYVIWPTAPSAMWAVERVA